MVHSAPPVWFRAGLLPVLALAIGVAGWLRLAPEPGLAYAGWLPGDGAHAWLASPTASFSVQQGRLTGNEAYAVIPVGVVDPSGSDGLWRVELNRLPAAGSTEEPARNAALTFAVTPAGLSLEAFETGNAVERYRPGIPVLTDDLVAGRTWADTLELTGAGSRRGTIIRAEATSRPAAAGCTESVLTLRAPSSSRVRTLTWCPGRGLTAFAENADDPQTLLGPVGRPPVRPAPVPAVPPWPTGPVRSEAVRPEVRRVAGVPLTVNPALADQVAVLPDGLVLHAASGTLFGLRHRPGAAWAEPDRAALELLWRVVLDGEVTALAAGESAAMVADAGGHLIAVGPTGAVLWRHRLPDAADAIAITGGAVVAHTLDGRLTAYDLGTGAELWSTGAGALQDPSWLQAAAGRVAMITADSLVVHDARTGAEHVRWSGIVPTAVALGADQVVVADAGLDMVAIGLDGRERWRLSTGLSSPRLAVVGDAVVAAGDGGAVRFDPGVGYGRISGTWDRLLVAGGGNVVLGGPDETVLVDPAGVVLGRWPGLTSSSVLAVTPFGLYGRAPDRYGPSSVVWR